MSFIEARKLLINHIKKNKWYGENKALIDPPIAFRNLIGISKTGYINFSDIDLLVKLCYKTDKKT